MGDADQLDWFRRELSKKFELKFRGRIGPDINDDKSIRILNRVVTWTTKGINYEADQRHVEIIIKQLSLDSTSKPVVTPGIKAEGPIDPLDEEPLSKEESTAYRAITARANYICQDRSDIQFAVKELSRAMAAPTQGDKKKLKRFGRYLMGRPRVVVEYNYQDEVSQLDGWTDSDYAGCRKIRKSTSGGLIMLGSHVLRSWASTQAIIALSSGEAEYYSIVKGSSIGLGIKRMLEDMGVKMKLRINTDASAAKGISSRRGAGKIRHIEVSQLWVQQKVRSGEISIRKVRTEENLADALTKYVSQEELNYHIQHTGLIISGGRHDLAPEINYCAHDWHRSFGNYCSCSQSVSCSSFVQLLQKDNAVLHNYTDHSGADQWRNYTAHSAPSSWRPHNYCNYVSEAGSITPLANMAEEECSITAGEYSHVCHFNYDCDPSPLLGSSRAFIESGKGARASRYN